jgi:hypothetical protein
MGEREQPGTKGGALRLPALARVDDAQPRVLEHLVGLCRQRRAEQPPHEAIERALVTPVELLERRGVAVGVEPHQGVVARVGRGHGKGKVCLIPL